MRIFQQIALFFYALRLDLRAKMRYFLVMNRFYPKKGEFLYA